MIFLARGLALKDVQQKAILSRRETTSEKIANSY